MVLIDDRKRKDSEAGQKTLAGHQGLNTSQFNPSHVACGAVSPAAGKRCVVASGCTSVGALAVCQFVFACFAVSFRCFSSIVVPTLSCVSVRALAVTVTQGRQHENAQQSPATKAQEAEVAACLGGNMPNVGRYQD